MEKKTVRNIGIYDSNFPKERDKNFQIPQGAENQMLEGYLLFLADAVNIWWKSHKTAKSWRTATFDKQTPKNNQLQSNLDLREKLFNTIEGFS